MLITTRILKRAGSGFGVGLSLALLLGQGCERHSTPALEPTLPVVERLPAANSVAKNVDATDLLLTQTVRGTLNLRIDGFASDKGKCRVAVYLGKSHFNDPEYAIAKNSILILDSRAELKLEVQFPLNSHAESGMTQIAVSAYHDENDNSRLDKNSFGIPIERYGFSTNPKRVFGPPKFSDAVIELDVVKLQSRMDLDLDVPITIK